MGIEVKSVSVSVPSGLRVLYNAITYGKQSRKESAPRTH